MQVTAEIRISTEVEALRPRHYENAVAAVLHHASANGMRVSRFFDQQAREEVIQISGDSQLFESVPALAELQIAKQLPA